MVYVALEMVELENPVITAIALMVVVDDTVRAAE
jgi:hypothetical protein